MDDDQQDTSPDDDLELSRQDPLNAHVGDEHLAEDFESPADSSEEDDKSDTHPSADTDVDVTERYDQGL